MMKQFGVGLLGFGTVGAGVFQGLQENRDLLASRLGIDLVVRRIGDLDITTDRGVEVDSSLLTTDAREVIADPSVDIVVELIGGSGIARTLMTEALQAGKPVVTANKKLLAEHGDELFSLAAEKGVDLGFGASVGGGIPVIRVAREALAGNRFRRVLGILNGTCNYILTRMEGEGLPFEQVLAEAQELGYAEANPALDIDGHDTAHKATILASLAYGFHVPLADVPVEGIRGLDGLDVRFARELGYRIKLLAVIAGGDEGDIEVRVHPALIPLGHMLASVSGVFNAVMFTGDLSGDTLHYGRGAGRAPTASTVISDIADVARGLAAGSPRHARGIPLAGAARRIRPLAEITSRYYLRLAVKDVPGTLGTLSTALGARGVSISAVIQKDGGADAGPFVPVVVITAPSVEADLDAALADIAASGILGAGPSKLRIVG
ncbi:MAG: homoserine dehydrogenase [Kiritimatiellia bacterium]|jgi:homoserine dehydrogenase